MNSNIASFFSLSSLSLSLSSFSSSDISVGISGGEAAVVFEEEVPVGLGAAVDVCDSCFEVEGEGEGEDIECRVTISHEYFSRKTRYCGPGDESLRALSRSFLALHDVGRKPERQFSRLIPWMVLSSESERLEEDKV